jgi:hypothetical protein
MKASILQRGARMGALALALGLALVPAPLPTPASAAAADEAQGLDVRTSSDLRSMKAQMAIDRLTVDNMTVEACDARVHWAPGGISHELFASDWSNIQDSAHIGSLSAADAGTDNGYRRQYGSANRYSVASVPGASTLANPFAPGNVYTLFNNHETGDGQGGTQSRGFKRGGFILDATIAGMGGGTFTGADGGPLLKLKFADAGRRVVDDTIETFDIQVEVKSITLNDVVRLENGGRFDPRRPDDLLLLGGHQRPLLGRGRRHLAQRARKARIRPEQHPRPAHARRRRLETRRLP